jgi:membrane protein YdbS with pleckstrin-like domain
MPSAVPAAADFSGWQPLPQRGAWLYAIRHAVAGAFLVAMALIVISLLLKTFPRWEWLALVLGAGLGAWIGLRRHRRVFWRLDSAGFAVRSGNWWRVDSRVPRSRVQHLDVKRGPVERSMGLATLVIYTAGTQMASVSVSLLDAHAAETLRDRLGRQLDSNDAL